MGAPSYCGSCGSAMPWAKASEAAEGKQRCPQCRLPQPANQALPSALEDLESEVEVLRAELSELRTKLEKEGMAMRQELSELRAKRKGGGRG